MRVNARTHERVCRLFAREPFLPLQPASGMRNDKCIQSRALAPEYADGNCTVAAEPICKLSGKRQRAIFENNDRPLADACHKVKQTHMERRVGKSDREQSTAIVYIVEEGRLWESAFPTLCNNQ